MIRTEAYRTAKPLVIMVIGNGKVTHLGLGNDETLCGREGQYDEIRGDIICTGCHRVAERMEAEANGAAAIDQGEIMAENTETKAATAEGSEHAAIVEQVAANIERAQSLAEAENAEGLAELNKETEALISSLPTRGKAPNEQTWAKFKQDSRTAFRAAASVQETAKAKTAKAKAAEVAAIDPADYSIYQGVTELVDDGAERIAEGVKLHLKTSNLAKEVASIMLDMWRRIPNKEGNPDIMGDSHAAKEAARQLYAKAGQGFEQNYETEDALAKLQRAVQSQRSDVRAKYLRELDENADEAKRFAKALESKPADVPVSQFIADAYGTQLKGHGELARERYQLKKEGKRPELEAAEDTTPDERIQTIVKKLKSDVAKTSVDDFEAATDETKTAVRAELEELYEAVKKMLAATL
jgi:hypothetical protein